MASESSSPKVQFGLATLLRLTAVAAALALIVRLVERSPTLREQLTNPGVGFAAAFTCIAIFIAPCDYWLKPGPDRRLATALAFLLVLWALQVLCALAAWHTWGEIAAFEHWLMIVSILIPAFLCAAHRYGGATVASVVIGVSMCPLWMTHASLMLRLGRLHTEVAAIAEHLESVKRDTGAYPSDLSGYDFERPMFQPLVTYFPPDSPSDSYVITFDLYEGDPTNCEYGPRHGWYYYPD